ncbi:hypothetical protein C8R48DRAFT_675071 [Suillus tomentosus]|nr:hypothetical protein C8R48DRAFT_675071 [Suillus tomentosus]
MDLFKNSWEPPRRKRDEDDQRPNKIFLKEVDQSSRLRDDVRELQFSKHDLLLRKRQIQINANSRELDLQSTITQYREHQGFLERDKADALTILNENHHKELAELQNRMALGLHEAQQEAVAREKLLAEKEAELARFSFEYSSKIASLDSQMRQANIARSPPSRPSWRHLVGKRPVATCTNIIPDPSSDSDGNEGPQTSIGGDAAPPLTSLLADVPIQDATVGMLVEALAKRRNNKANVRELFYTAFHIVKDDEYMLHVTASREAISSFTHGLGPGPDPLELHWDMTTTHISQWNHKYTGMFEKDHSASRSRQSIINDITKKFNQCRHSWRKAQPHMLSDGTRETMQEVEDRLVDQTNERLRLTRVLTRRATKFETRKKVMSALLSDRIATGKDDQVVWAYLQSLVETLGKDGMSSDESIWLKKMPWRADVDNEMRIIDQQRLAGAANFTPRGSKPAKRFHMCYSASLYASLYVPPPLPRIASTVFFDAHITDSLIRQVHDYDKRALMRQAGADATSGV